MQVKTAIPSTHVGLLSRSESLTKLQQRDIEPDLEDEEVGMDDLLKTNREGKCEQPEIC